MKKTRFIGMLLIAFVYSIGSAFGAGFTSISDHNVKVSDNYHFNATDVAVSTIVAIAPIEIIAPNESSGSVGIVFFREEGSASEYTALNSYGITVHSLAVLESSSGSSGTNIDRNDKALHRYFYVRIPKPTYTEVDNSHMQNKLIKETALLSNWINTNLLHTSRKNRLLS